MYFSLQAEGNSNKLVLAVQTSAPPTKTIEILRRLHQFESDKYVEPSLELDDIFISVKTTKDYHDTRLSMIVKTWFQLAKDQVGLVALFS